MIWYDSTLDFNQFISNSQSRAPMTRLPSAIFWRRRCYQRSSMAEQLILKTHLVIGIQLVSKPIICFCSYPSAHLGPEVHLSPKIKFQQYVVKLTSSSTVVSAKERCKHSAGRAPTLKMKISNDIFDKEWEMPNCIGGFRSDWEVGQRLQMRYFCTFSTSVHL